MVSTGGLVDFEECGGLFYTRRDFSELYVPREKLQNRFLEAVQECDRIWVSGPGGAGKTTLVNWLTKHLLEHPDQYKIFPIYIKLKPMPLKAITSAREAIEFLAENGAKEYFKGRNIREFLEKARLGLSILEKWLPQLDPLTSIVLKIIGSLLEVATSINRTLSEETYLERVAEILNKRISKIIKDFKYTKVLLIIDDLGNIEDVTSRIILLNTLTSLAEKAPALKILVVRREFKAKKLKYRRGLLGVIKENEEEVLETFHKIEVPGLTLDELDVLGKIVEKMPYRSTVKFKFKEDEEEEILRELYSRTGGLLRVLCIAMHMYGKRIIEATRGRDWNILTLKRIKKYVEKDVKKIIDAYLSYLARIHGGVYAKKFCELIKLTSCMKFFDEENLMGITGYSEEAVEKFLEWKGVKETQVIDEKRYTYSDIDFYQWLKLIVYETVLSEEKKIKYHKKIVNSLKEQEKSSLHYAEIIYQCEKLLDLVKKEDEKKYYVELLIDSAIRLSVAFHRVGFLEDRLYYGRKVLEYGSEVGEWKKVLGIAEFILMYSVDLQLSKREVDEIVEYAKTAYNKLLEVDRGYAKAIYAAVKAREAYYYLKVLSDRKKAEKLISEAHKILEEEQEYSNRLPRLLARLAILLVETEMA